MCRHARAKVRTIKRTCGNKVAPEEAWCSISAWVADAMGRKRLLGEFEGILQTNGYAAYDQIGGPTMVHAACWAHARRQFFEAVQLNPQRPSCNSDCRADGRVVCR